MDSLPSRCMWTLFLIFLTGILRCFETAVNNVNEAKLQKLAEDGDKRAKNVLLLVENPNKFYNSIRVFTILIELSVSFLAAYFMPGSFFPQLPQLIGAAISIVIVAAFILVFGVYAPKRIADLHADSIVLKMWALLRLLYLTALPVSMLLTFVSNLFLLIFGIKPNDTEEEVTEEEIRMMVDIGSENGTIDPDEKEMIHNIFELDNTQVENIMTHRTDTEL
ncbi:MAG: CNNM domain-containing protein, partial [Clostridiales bacterium]|nr:CNNM domain-containing protein [Clostridiales bacterium]